MKRQGASPGERLVADSALVVFHILVHTLNMLVENLLVFIDFLAEITPVRDRSFVFLQMRTFVMLPEAPPIFKYGNTSRNRTFVFPPTVFSSHMLHQAASLIKSLFTDIASVSTRRTGMHDRRMFRQPLLAFEIFPARRTKQRVSVKFFVSLEFSVAGELSRTNIARKVVSCVRHQVAL